MRQLGEMPGGPTLPEPKRKRTYASRKIAREQNKALAIQRQAYAGPMRKDQKEYFADVKKLNPITGKWVGPEEWGPVYRQYFKERLDMVRTMRQLYPGVHWE